MAYAVKLLVERERTPIHKAALTIARAIGGLLDPRENDREPIEKWEEFADYLRGIFKGEHKDFLYSDHDPTLLVGEVGIFLVRDKTGKLGVALRPEDLAQALILYAARMVAIGTRSHTCENCGNLFLSGGVGRGKDKKRADARFCSDRCRWTYHNEQNRKSRS
jgi:hypothetical protein